MKAAALALLALALLSSLSFAAKDPLSLFLNRSFEPDQSVSALSLSGAGSAGLYLVSAGGSETYIFNATSGKWIAEQGQISAILLADLFNRTAFEAKARALENLSSEISAAKKAKEGKCLQYTGLDSHPCTDKQSCLVSCFAVPQCEIVVQSDTFLEAMMDWNAQRQKFDLYLLTYSTQIEAIRTDSAAIDAKDAILSKLYLLAENMSNNAMFLTRNDSQCQDGNLKCYEYCPKNDYSQTRIQSARQTLSDLKSTLRTVSQQQSRSAAIANRTSENEQYLATRGARFQEFRIEMASGISRLSGEINSLKNSLSDPDLEPAFAQLSQMSQSINSQADSGLLRQALSRKDAYESAQSAIEDRLAYDASALSSLRSKITSLRRRLNDSERIIGKPSADGYRANITIVEILIAPPKQATGANNSSSAALLTLDEVSTHSASLDALNYSLTVEIAAKATGGSGGTGVPVQLPKGIPCLPALLAPFALAFAFLRKAA